MLTPERFYVAVTDTAWFAYLRAAPFLDEVNFWSPSGRKIVAPRGMPFLFKLKAPDNRIGGGGFLAFVDRMSIRDAWEFFGQKNGAPSLDELKRRIDRNRSRPAGLDDAIGCSILSQPFFFADPIAAPADWATHTQTGKYYHAGDTIADTVWQDVVRQLEFFKAAQPAGQFGGYGAPSLRPTRLGQGAFRKLVLDAYGRRCAVSGEHTVPVLQASHIKPFAEVERHEITNGVALRSDIHTLFDRGYVSITPDYTFVVSDRLKEDFDNGEIYYKYAEQRQRILLPSDRSLLPDREHLAWHLSECFKG